MNANSASAVLQVSDLPAALEFYMQMLGFEKQFVYGDPPFYAGVTMGKIALHLNAGGENLERQGKGSVYVFCDEVDTYYQTLKKRGIEITSEIETWPYQMRDFQIKDRDGNLLCFGCPTD